MKLSELIKELSEIEKEYPKSKVDVIVVNENLIIREIIKDSPRIHHEKFITAITIE